MYASALLVAVSALLGNVCAAPTLTATYLDVTNLNIHYIADDSSSMSFNLTDRSPTANDTASCYIDWQGATPGDSRPIVCTGKTAYEFSVDRWTDYNDFLLHFKHSYHEPSVGVPDYLTVFANVAVNATSLGCSTCDDADSTTINCAQPAGTVIKAPITSMIAKK